MRIVSWVLFVMSVVGAAVIPARAEGTEPAQPRWGFALEGGMHGRLFSTGEIHPRAIFGTRVGHRIWRYLEVGVHGRLVLEEDFTQLDFSADASFRLDWGRWRFVAGLGLGAAAMHVSRGEQGLWTEALLLQPELGVGFAALPWLEVRAYPAKISLYYNEFWMSVWEPSLVLIYRL